MTTTFSALNLRGPLLDALTKLGYEEPTPIQAEAIPTLIEGHDLLAQAATGTGKTAAFALPILQQLAEGEKGKNPTALVLTPTRELAVQVSEAMHKYGKELGARVVPIYGGQPIDRQLRALKQGVDVVVATPGRAIDHIKRKTLKLSDLKMVILDEADEMLDMGFAEEIDEILSSAPQQRQTALFSATMPPRIESIARSHLQNPKRIEIAKPKQAEGEAPRVRQTAYLVPRAHKTTAIGRVLDVESPTAAIVFCRTREQVDQLTTTLNGRGYRAEALHGGMNQDQRDKVMGRVRKGVTDLLIATDVAARGLDIDQLTHVINYDVPSAPEAYVHRIGRVGRAGREGVAVTFTEPREHRMLKTIERVTKQKITIEKIPTVADMQARRIEATTNNLEETLVSEGDALERYRVVAESLSDEYDPMLIAMAAIKMAHEANGVDTDEREIPEVSTSNDRNAPRNGQRNGNGGNPRMPEKRNRRGPSPDMARIYVGVGRKAGVRPGDLVGAIANEAGLAGKEIGSIDITDKFSIVEVPESAVGGVIASMKRTTIKGTKASVRRDRGRQ
jgi:ATP-dependent RNA helicase DeaD